MRENIHIHWTLYRTLSSCCIKYLLSTCYVQMLRIQQQRRNSSPNPYSKTLLQGDWQVKTGRVNTGHHFEGGNGVVDDWDLKMEEGFLEEVIFTQRSEGWVEIGGQCSRRERYFHMVVAFIQINMYSSRQSLWCGRRENPNIEQTVRVSHRIRTYIALGVYRGGREGILARGAADVGWASKDKWAGIENAGGQEQVHLRGPREENLRVNRP